MAAEDAVLRALLRPGDHVVLPARRVRRHVPARRPGATPRPGVDWTAADLARPDALADALRPETRVVWVETPTNPALGIVDIDAVARGRARAAARAWSSTTRSRRRTCRRPLALGADVVVHSTTKYLGGHSDTLGGFVAVADAELGERIAFLQNAMGAVPGPFDAYLVLRGIKTLAVRMDRHCENAAAVAAMLDAHPAVARVLYPGLASHPGHEVAARQMRGVRRDGELPRRRRRGRRARDRPHAPSCSRWPSRSARSSRSSSTRPDDARVGGRLAARGRSGAGPALGRARVDRRPPRRPRARARRRLLGRSARMTTRRSCSRHASAGSGSDLRRLRGLGR